MTATIYPGRVAQLDPAGPLVLVPQLGQGVLWGPLQDMSSPPARVGDQVAVANLGASRDQLLILGPLTGRAPTIDEVAGLAALLDAHDVRLDTAEIAASTDRMMLEDQRTRLDALDVEQDQQDTRLAAGEAKDTQQDNRLTATEGVANGAAAAATTVRSDTLGQVTTKGDLLIATGPGTVTRQPVVPVGWMLSGDANSPTGWAARDVLGLPRGLAGVTSPTRFVGATTTGAPATGTFAVGDFVVSHAGDLHVCTVAGTPGTWATHRAAAALGIVARARRTTDTTATSATTVAGATGITRLSAPVVTGRLYRVATSPMQLVYANNPTATAVSEFHLHVAMGAAATTASTDHAQVNFVSPANVGSGIPDGRVFEALYPATTTGTLHILLTYLLPVPGGGGTVRVACTAKTALELTIEDTGIDPGISGTQL